MARSINYAYSPSGDLASVTDRDSNVTSFAYSPSQPHFLTQITDGLGNVVMSGQYNTSGRLTQITNATGPAPTLSYNLGNLSESATAPGNTNPTTNTYNTEGLLTQSVDADGNVTNYTYNGLFLASETQVIPGGTNLTTTYTNNSYGQDLTETDPAGNTTYYSYSSFAATKPGLTRRRDSPCPAARSMSRWESFCSHEQAVAGRLHRAA